MILDHHDSDAQTGCVLPQGIQVCTVSRWVRKWKGSTRRHSHAYRSTSMNNKITGICLSSCWNTYMTPWFIDPHMCSRSVWHGQHIRFEQNISFCVQKFFGTIRQRITTHTVKTSVGKAGPHEKNVCKRLTASHRRYNYDYCRRVAETPDFKINDLVLSTRHLLLWVHTAWKQRINRQTTSSNRW